MPGETQVFARQLNYYMNLNGKTQIDLINDLGVNKSTISTWCSGKKMPRMGTIQTLADYFGIMKSDLIEAKERLATEIGDELSPNHRALIEAVMSMDDDTVRTVFELVKQVKKLRDPG